MTLAQVNEELIPTQQIADTILVLRGQKVILDRELARLYGVQTRVLNQAVKRNSGRFPEDFMFVLSQTLKFSKQVHAFTEQGVAMPSSVLNSDRAVRVNIAIVRAFVRLRERLETNRALAQKFDELEKHVGALDKEISAIIEAIRLLMTPAEKPGREIGFHVRETAPTYPLRRRR